MSKAKEKIHEMIDQIRDLPAEDVEIPDLKKLSSAALSKAKEKFGS
ncbi:MAG: hypothetical protein KAU48_09495 [Candidatus Thorarchaeota archaeon]|nr:hypothetical protein [Candidatus Thorarchaeota archaeon]